MRGEEAVTAVAMPEAGRDGEQPLPPAGLGCGVRGETGGRGPQESRKQCEFSFSLGPRGRAPWLPLCQDNRGARVVLKPLSFRSSSDHAPSSWDTETPRGATELLPPVALEGIWSIERNLPVGGLKPGLPSRNSLLPQAKYYSRHGGLRSKANVLLTVGFP
ncbi:uncharacterized protein C11orf97 homolog [Globicephala melas]|uniref:uncharacterized protein C11orf97 homolog n=1 Tax=Globicephala melas TaxID=9731 RepID=UPI00293D394E|nr:uncharacterized protein C11orf97 homolog [Globicephala melas]